MSNTLFIPNVKLPELPEGYRFLVMVMLGRRDAEVCWRRVFAVRVVAHFRLPKWGGKFGEMEVFPAGSASVVYKFDDANCAYEFLLPRRSYEFVGGSWIGRRRAKSDY